MRLLQEQGARMARERRLLQEHARLNAGFNMQGWHASPEGELCVNFELKLPERVYCAVLVYPELFPDVPAFVRPQRAGEPWSGHQYLGSGVLCLEYGPDNWHPDITGVELVKSTNLLLWGEFIHKARPKFGPVPSRHQVSRAQVLSANPARLVVTRTLKGVLAGPGRNEPVQLRCSVSRFNGESVSLVLQAGTPLVAISDLPDSLASDSNTQCAGVAVPVPSVAALERVKDAQELQACLGAAWPWDDGLAEEPVLLLAHDDEGQLTSFVLKGGSSPLFQRNISADYSADSSQRLPDNFSKLLDVSVAIVGMGSLGSKIAISLARSGVRKFVLVDDDVLAPHNLVRNEFNWQDVGFTKLAAAARALELVAPDVSVTAWPVKIAEQGNPSVFAMVAKAIASCTMVIDATASPSAFVALAALTKRAGKPMVWGEVLGGGGGGLMARSRPGVDTDALGVRNHVHGVLKGMAPAPKGETAAYGLESEGTVYVASDADVGSLAASMTQFSLDTLCADHSEYPDAAYLIGFRKFWIFRCPFDVLPVTCPSATSPEPQPQSDRDQRDLAEMHQLISEGTCAANHDAL